MKTSTKIILIVAVLLLIGGAIYYFSNKSKVDALNKPAGNDPFSIDDDAAYKGARSLLPENDRVWVDKEVAAAYSQASDEEFKLNGRMSKTFTLIRLCGRMNPNEKGKFTDKSGNKVLWPQKMFDDMWTLYYNPLAAKYGGLV